MVGGLYACASGSQTAELPEGEETPVRLGQVGTIDTTRMVGPYTVRQAYEKADMVAELEVSGYLGEYITEYGGATYFNAKLQKVYKNETGNELAELTLVQAGNSEYTEAGYPLFNRGDRIIVFLVSVENEYTSEYKNCFIIIGTSQTNIKIFTYKGNEYAINLGCPELFQDISSVLKDNVLEGLSTAFLKFNPIWKEIGVNSINKAILFSELESYIVNLDK